MFATKNPNKQTNKEHSTRRRRRRRRRRSCSNREEREREGVGCLLVCLLALV